MAGYVCNGLAVDYADGEGRCVVNGREYWWDFHEYTGPMFYRRDWVELKRQPSTKCDRHGRPKSPVWQAFEKWHKRYMRLRKKAKAHETVVC